MMKALITDVSKVLLFPKDEEYGGSLNSFYKDKSSDPDFKFFDYFELNTELLDFYKTLKDKLDVYILTSDAIQDAPELQPYWNDVITQIFSASKMGTHKSEPSAYQTVLSELSLNANDVIYIDDNEVNIKAAASVGLKTILYGDNTQTISEINKLTI